MRAHLFAFIIMMALVLIAQQYPFGEMTGRQGATIIALGFVILAGYLLGELLILIKLPRISGYLFAGMLFGPHLEGILTQQNVQDLMLIDTIALSLIALSAGGELHLSSLKRGWKGISIITALHVVGVMSLTAAFFYFASNQFKLWDQFNTIQLISASLIFGVIAVAQSPATTIAIISETKASGPATETMIGIAVIKDVLVIALFTVALQLIDILNQGLDSVDWGPFLSLGGEILFSIIVGILAGIFISLYLRFVNANPVLFILAFSYLVSIGSRTFHLDSILVCVFAGAWVTNASKRGKELIGMIDKGALIIYVIFFCVAGASLDLSALNKMKWIALLLVLARMAFLAITTWGGVKLSGIEVKSPKTYWMAFLPQAGVSLGLVAILYKRGFDWASELYTLIVACIALNQILGPITMKYALQKSGEIKPDQD